MNNIKNFKEFFLVKENISGLSPDVKFWLIDTLQSHGSTFDDQYDDEDDTKEDSNEVYLLADKIKNGTLTLQDCAEIMFQLYQIYYNNVNDPESDEDEALSDILMDYESDPVINSYEEFYDLLNKVYEIVESVDFVMENYKSDTDIENEFLGFSIEQIDFESKNMNGYKPNTFKGYVYWSFPEGDESVGGGSKTTSEDFIYNIDNGTFKYSVNSWYPENIYLEMINVLGKNLEEKYSKKFQYLKGNEFNKVNEI